MTKSRKDTPPFHPPSHHWTLFGTNQKEWIKEETVRFATRKRKLKTEQVSIAPPAKFIFVSCPRATALPSGTAVEAARFTGIQKCTERSRDKPQSTLFAGGLRNVRYYIVPGVLEYRRWVYPAAEAVKDSASHSQKSCIRIPKKGSSLGVAQACMSPISIVVLSVDVNHAVQSQTLWRSRPTCCPLYELQAVL
ncbi:hypothetical protein HPB51_002279 [Rhipicephalus microplus]|uniref:Uncharacterized protein n=1 Tax=Rhipicephalus microplus TaxID=6941 RepID=A0A9J6DYB0_RHIMP|nr:hypothetical protein HPB51_002279 [Rhipicephalus microplus]